MDTANMEEIGYVATIGMFDGVHRGHQFVLQQVVDEARKRGLQSMAITFDKQTPSMLTPLVEKRQLISRVGIHRIEVLTFDDALRQMTARQFMQQVLKDILQGLDARHIVALDYVTIYNSIRILLQHHYAACRIKPLHIREAADFHVVRKRLP